LEIRYGVIIIITARVDVLSLSTHREVINATANMLQASRRLSSGLRINSAADDPAGMAIMQRMRSQLRSVAQAGRNSHDAVSLIRTAESGISSISNMVTRMRDLVTIASNDTMTRQEREAIQIEIDELMQQIDLTASQTQFNTIRLLDGSFARPMRETPLVSPSTPAPPDPSVPRVNVVSPSVPVLGPSPDLVAPPSTPTVINASNINDIGSNWAFADGVLTLAAGYNFRIDGFQMHGYDALDISRIVVQGTSSTDTNIVLNNVSLNRASPGVSSYASLDLGDNNVNLWLLGNNVIDSGIRTTGENLTIHGTGSLIVSGGFRTSPDTTAAIDAAGTDISIRAGLLEVASGQRILADTIDVRGGNLSINPADIVGSDVLTRSGEPAHRVQISLQNSLGVEVRFGSHSPVRFTINDEVIDAVTDSRGNLFMYLPTDFTDQRVTMRFGERTFTGFLDISANHDNQLALRMVQEPSQPLHPPAEFAAHSPGRVLHFQVGPNSGHSMFLHIEAMHSQALGLRDINNNSVINVVQGSGEEISRLVDRLDLAHTIASREQARMGAALNRLEFTIDSLYNTEINLSEASSRIGDADMAREMSNFVSNRITLEAGMAMLARNTRMPAAALLLDVMG